MCDSWKMWNKQSSYFSRERNSAFFDKFSLSREVRLLFFLNKEKIIKYNQIMIYISFECLRCFLESEKLMINNFFVWKNPFSLGLRIDQNDQSSVPMIAESFKKIKKYRWLWFEKSKWLDINLSIQKKKKLTKWRCFPSPGAGSGGWSALQPDLASPLLLLPSLLARLLMREAQPLVKRLRALQEVPTQHIRVTRITHRSQ